MGRNSSFIRAELGGVDEIRRNLETLSLEMRGPILAKAVGAAARPIVKIARRLAPRDTGALAKSIDSDIRRPRRGGLAYAIIGPVRGVFRGGKPLKSGRMQAGDAVPANYAHLVEFGHLKVKPIKGTSRRKKTAQMVGGLVAGKPFMQPAFIAGASLAGQEFSEAIKTELARSVQKLRTRKSA